MQSNSFLALKEKSENRGKFLTSGHAVISNPDLSKINYIYRFSLSPETKFNKIIYFFFFFHQEITHHV